MTTITMNAPNSAPGNIRPTGTGGHMLTQASRQWATRPPDQRFWTLDGLLTATREHRQRAAESAVDYAHLRVETTDHDNLAIVSSTSGRSATLSEYAFKQMSARIGAPAGYLQGLPPTLAAQNINHGLKARGEGKARLLFSRGESVGGIEPLTLRASLSEKYQRIWNCELVDALTQYAPEGWKPPPARPAPHGDPRSRPATIDDISKRRPTGGIPLKVGDPIAPAGLYASDRDLFVFLVDEDHPIDDGTPDGLARGFMLWNSEVGDRSLGGLSFLYKSVCGNHIVWDAQDVAEFSMRHVGRVRGSAFSRIGVDLRAYANAKAGDVESKIAKARAFEIAASKEDTIAAVLDFARRRKLTAINADTVATAFDRADAHRAWYNVAPTTVYGIVQGLTETAQLEEHAGDRVALDRQAGRVMEMAF